MSREPDAAFARRLRGIDPGLIARWNHRISRWQIFKLWSKGHTRDGHQAKGVKRALLSFQGHVDEQPLYRMHELGAFIGTLTGPNGEYRDLDDTVLCDLRQADQWRKAPPSVDQQIKDQQEREEETHRRSMEELDHEIGGFINWIGKNKIDLGAHNAL